MHALKLQHHLNLLIFFPLMSLKEFRTWDSKICHFGILIIWTKGTWEGADSGRALWPLLLYPKTGHKISHEKGGPLYQEEKNILVSQRLGINVEVDLYKQTYSNDVILSSTGFPPTPFMSYCLPHNLLPLAQTLLPFLHKSITSWSKSIKASCFGHFLKVFSLFWRPPCTGRNLVKGVCFFFC